MKLTADKLAAAETELSNMKAQQEKLKVNFALGDCLYTFKMKSSGRKPLSLCHTLQVKGLLWRTRRFSAQNS